MSRKSQCEKRRKSGKPLSIESLLDKRGKAADDKTGKASNEDPKIAVLDNIKQDLKADEVGDLIDSELATIVTSLLTKGMVDDKLQEKINRTAQPQNCEALTKVKVNQLIWDTLTLSLLKRPKAANRKWLRVPKPAKSGQENMTILACPTRP